MTAKYKQVTMVVNQEDIRKLVGGSLSNVLIRHGTQYAECVDNLNISVTSGDKEDILGCLRKMLEIFNATAGELNASAPLISEIENPPGIDTEVIEDLSNEGKVMGEIGLKGSEIMPDGSLEDIE